MSQTDSLLEQLKIEVERVGAALDTADPNVILVWAFADAPASLRELSDHGGDEDWLAVVPANDPGPLWADDGTPFGCCSVSRHDLVDGRYVLIGAHS